MVVLSCLLLLLSYEQALVLDSENADLLDYKVKLLKEFGKLEEALEW